MRKVIVSGGGSGGHIFPALAIANEIKRRHPEVDILFVGAKGKMEMEKVPNAGYPIKGLWISGIQRKLTLKNLMFPLKLISSLWNSQKIIRKFKPEVAIGVGGYASGPLLRMAAAKKVPCVIQEQNSFPGITNKWLATKVDKICVAYDNMERFFPKDKIVFTGNPVRSDMGISESKKSEALTHFGLKSGVKTILVIGGSLGARSVNNAMVKHLEQLQNSDYQVIWQTGKFYYQDLIDGPAKNVTDNIKVKQFINRMDLAYAAADVIVSRAGAMSISELCLVGKPVILVPSPNVSEDHQTKNAMALVNKRAAVLLKDNQVVDDLWQVVSNLLENQSLRQELSQNIKGLANPEATKMIVDQIEELLK